MMCSILRPVGGKVINSKELVSLVANTKIACSPLTISI